MKVVRTFDIEEFPNPHAISARLLHAGQHEQFEHLMLGPGQVQKRHASYTTVHLYVLEGEGTLDADEECIHISTDMLIVMPPETLHRLTNTGAARLRVLSLRRPQTGPAGKKERLSMQLLQANATLAAIVLLLSGFLEALGAG